MYCDYWNLKTAPFDNVPDPAMYADCHTSMENVISETLFAIQEANESFAVIISDTGVGKTLSLRMIAEALQPDHYKVGFITNPSLSFPQLLREIITQITGQKCEETQKGDLLDLLKHLLIESMEQGRKVVILIDEANTLSSANLEDLRLLTNMQDDRHNLFTLVLAGNLELAERLEHPHQAGLFQRIGAYGRIDKLPSIESVKMYIETRLKMAGTNIRIFSDDCMSAIWEYSEHGVPRLINKICKLCLKAGETNQFDYISPDVVAQIAARYQKLSATTVQITLHHNQAAEINNIEEKTSEETMSVGEAESGTPAEAELAPETIESATDNVILFPVAIVEDEIPLEKKPEDAEAFDSIPTEGPSDIAVQSEKVEDHENKAMEETAALDLNPVLLSQWEEVISELPDVKVSAMPALMEEAVASSSDKTPLTAEPVDVSEHTPEDLYQHASDLETQREEMNAVCSVPVQSIQASENQGADGDVIVIGEHRIPLSIPKDILKQVKSFNRENANKSAGFWAAQIIKKNPQLTLSSQSDPVHVWNEIKDNILKKIAL